MGECGVCHASFDVSEYGMCGMLVCVSLSINVCMFTVSNALLMSNATEIVRVGRIGWLKPVTTVLLMLCSAVFSLVFFIVIFLSVVLVL